MTRQESSAVLEMLDTCEHVVKVVELRSLSAVEETPEKVAYDSCGEAGEPRVQGSSGGRRGFPKEKVLSALDGEEDGVICQR